MIVKKFQAPTEMEAVLKAKDELGSSAVVLNVKTLKQRGVFRLFKKDVVEITAALEENEYASDIVRRRPVLETQQPDEVEAKSQPNINLLAGEESDFFGATPETEEIEKKLDSLQNLLQTQMGKNYDNRKREQNLIMPQTGSASVIQNDSELPIQRVVDREKQQQEKVIQERENANIKFLQLIYKQMIQNEVDEQFANRIIGDIENSLKKESNIDSILAAVYQKIILSLGEPHTIQLGEKPKVVFFIGPTGVGKTTTIAKIASKFKLDEHAKVAFITSDTYRIAAVEQLNTYASIIDCPVSVVYSAQEMKECLTNYREYDLIMVDTAGRSHKEEEQMLELADLIAEVKNDNSQFDYEIYLTLSLTTKYKDLMSITQKYKDIIDWSVIFTKLDETCALGNILNIRMATGASLSYATLGQNVPNDIEVIDAQALAKQIMGGK